MLGCSLEQSHTAYINLSMSHHLIFFKNIIYIFSWFEASAECEMVGGYLAEPKTKA